MTPWQWWAGDYGAVEYENGYELGDFPSRTAAISAGRKKWPGEIFCIVEARSSTAKKYQHGEHEMIPFISARHHEIINPEPSEVVEKITNILKKRSAFWMNRAAQERALTPWRWWKFYQPNHAADFESMASELDLLTDEINDDFLL